MFVGRSPSVRVGTTALGQPATRFAATRCTHSSGSDSRPCALPALTHNTHDRHLFISICLQEKYPLAPRPSITQDIARIGRDADVDYIHLVSDGADGFDAALGNAARR